MTKNKKRILMVVIVTLVSTIGITKVLADDWGFDGINANATFYIDAPSASTSGCPSKGGTTCVCGGRLTGYREELKLSETLYNTESKKLGEALIIQKIDRFVAGRFIGIDAYEQYNKIYTYAISASCTSVKLVCEHTRIKCCYAPPQRPQPVKPGQPIPIFPVSYTMEEKVIPQQMTDQVCPGEYYYPCGVETTTYETTDSCNGNDGVKECPSSTSKTAITCHDSEVAKLNNIVKNDLEGMTPSYVAKRQDVNDINVGVENDEPQLTQGIEVTGYRLPGTPEVTNGSAESGYEEITQTAVMKYSYNLGTACINTQTAEVIYVKSTEKCPANHMEVREITTTLEDKIVHVGQYFMPLNATRADLLRYYLLPNMKKKPLSEGLCYNLLENYGTNQSEELRQYFDWHDIVVDSNGNKFSSTTTITEAKNRIKGKGCYLAYLSAFQSEQKFYTPELKGYNYYYRPIDYNEPFPNGLSDGSFWNGIYDDRTKKVTYTDAGSTVSKTYDLLNSFEKVTYETGSGYNGASIRNYNALTGESDDEDKIYGSWAGMNSTGTSSFIGNYDYVVRKECDSVYALGCGPANADWEVCKNKTEVCG